MATSQWDCLGEDPITDQGRQAAGRDDIDLPADDSLRAQAEASEGPAALSRHVLAQEIQVALAGRVATREGAEHPEFPEAALLSQLNERLALLLRQYVGELSGQALVRRDSVRA